MEEHALGVFISGSGTTFGEIAKACRSGEIPNAKVACVISSNPNAYGNIRARACGIPCAVVKEKDYKRSDGTIDREAYGERMLEILNTYGVTAVGLHGFLKLVPPCVIEWYEGRIFNQHPANPLFGGSGMYGRTVHGTVLEFWKLLNMPQVPRRTEVIAQRVAPEYDKGEVLVTIPVGILSGDTPESLQARALPSEHRTQITLWQRYVAKELHRVACDPIFEHHRDVAERAKEIVRGRKV